jgi:hypothetical protein
MTPPEPAEYGLRVLRCRPVGARDVDVQVPGDRHLAAGQGDSSLHAGGSVSIGVLAAPDHLVKYQKAVQGGAGGDVHDSIPGPGETNCMELYNREADKDGQSSYILDAVGLT